MEFFENKDELNRQIDWDRYILETGLVEKQKFKQQHKKE